MVWAPAVGLAVVLSGRLHVRHWGAQDAPALFMLHGWMDVAASFQFVVDALDARGGDWQVIAPDLRGFGLSDWPVAQGRGSNYWFPDYLADLDVVVRHVLGTLVIVVARRAALALRLAVEHMKRSRHAEMHQQHVAR